MKRAVAFVLLVAGCGTEVAPPGTRVDAGRSDAGPVLRFYLGSYMEPSLVDSVLSYGGNAWRLDMARIGTEAPEFRGALDEAAADGFIDRDELREAVQATYAAARGLPDSAQDLETLPGFAGVHIEMRVRGSMTAYERLIRIPEIAVENALRTFAAEGALRYEPGTVVVGQHLEDGLVVETTAMIRRPDGFWDFAAYGPDGALAGEIRGERGGVAVPTLCFGCHYGDRAFEPEASFPSPAADGPHGPRLVDVSEHPIDQDAVRKLDEHRRRSDGLLGLYATLLVGRWKAEGARLPDDRTRLLETLGL